MTLGYGGRLYILAFDHRGSFRKKMFGISGREPTDEELHQLRDAKRLVWEGFRRAVEDGAPTDSAGVLVDEEMGADIAREAKSVGVQLAMPVEKSGQDVFDFEYGESFGDHINDFDPAFTKVLVRWNPADSPEIKEEQAVRLKKLSDWLHERGRKFLFELLVPASDRDLRSVSGDAEAYDSRVRPVLMLQAINELQEAGVEPDIWKIEGIDASEDCALISGLLRSDGRDDVAAVVLGRGADQAKVDHWLQTGAAVDGYSGFAIGRSIWWTGVEGFKDGELTRDEAAADIAARYLRFIEVYDKATA